MRLWRKPPRWPPTADSRGRSGTTLWVPWAGKAAGGSTFCAGQAITLSGIYYWALLPFRASLLGTHPVVSELLNGSTEAIVAAAAFARVGHGSVVVALLAAIPGLMIFDPLYGGRVGCGASASSRCCPADATAGAGTWGTCSAGAASSPGPPWSSPRSCPSPTRSSSSSPAGPGCGCSRSSSWTSSARCCGRACWPASATNSATTRSWWRRPISHYGLWISIALIAVIVVAQVRSQRHMMRVAAEARANAGAWTSRARAGRTARAMRLQALRGSGVPRRGPASASTTPGLRRGESGRLRTGLPATRTPGSVRAARRALRAGVGRQPLIPQHQIPGGEISLAWHHTRRNNHTIIWRNE